MKKLYRRAFIEITNRCNLACAFCAVSRRPKVDMPLEDFESAAVQAGALAGVLSLHVLGEPLLHPRFPDILRACSRLGLRVNLVTNGTLLDEYPPSLFAENCLSQLSVSLHALAGFPPAERGRALCRLADFARAKPPALTLSFRLRAAGGVDFRDQAVKILAAAFKAPALQGTDHVKLAAGIFINFGGLFSWPGAGGGAPRGGCLGLRHHFGVLSDGRVVPCCADYDGAMALGNLKEKPLAGILGSPGTVALKAAIAGKTPMPAFCASCGFAAPDT
jgi:hypothetical protein